MAEKKVSLWKRLRFKFRITVVNDTMYEEIFHFRVSLLRIIVGLGILAMLLVLVTSYLIAFTSIREWIPGYPDKNFRTEMLSTSLRLDSIQEELDKRDNFIRSLQIMIGGGEYGQEPTDTVTEEVEIASGAKFDTIMLRITEEELAFRTEIENEERFSLGLGIKPANKEYYHFYSPVTGYVVSQFHEKEKHYGIDVVTKKDAPVMAVLDGVVVFADWTINTGHVVAIQHSNDLMTVYKHNSNLMCKQGDYVRAGQVIANVGDTGKETTGPHLHFEIWRAGNPLNPEDFIQFK